MPTLARIPIQVAWDTEAIFRAAGGNPSDLQKLLRKYNGGRAPNLPAIQMWRARRTIPAAWLAVVIYALMREGHRVATVLVAVQPPQSETTELPAARDVWPR